MAASILIVDDAVSIRQALSYVLEKNGYIITQSSNGVEALSQVEKTKFNLIICDVNMPQMDGIEFIKTMKSDPKYSENKYTPVVMLTTESSADKKAEGKQIGVKAWMVKPFPPEKLLESVKMLIG